MSDTRRLVDKLWSFCNALRDDGVATIEYSPTRSTPRVETDRFRAFTYDEVVARDKANLDLVWLKDDSLEDLDNLPAPEVIAREDSLSDAGPCADPEVRLG